MDERKGPCLMKSHESSSDGQMKPIPLSRTAELAIARLLESSHAELVEARKIAALSKHESYEEIGDAIDCVEAAFVWLKTQIP